MAQEEFLDEPMPDIIEQWRFYFSVLQPEDSNTIIDIGCNTGDAERLLLREYPNVGRVVGIDNDHKRYDKALIKWQRDGKPPQIELKLANALDLPFPDAYFDRALCVETLEWVKEPLKALQEIRRVLKPNGSALIIHSDFDTQVFSSTNKKLCREIVHTFSDSGPNGQIGRELYGLCNEAGFQTAQPTIYMLINTEWKPNSYAYKVAHMMVDWLIRKSLVSKDRLQAWLTDLETQHSKGVFFYSINRYMCYCLEK